GEKPAVHIPAEPADEVPREAARSRVIALSGTAEIAPVQQPRQEWTNFAEERRQGLEIDGSALDGFHQPGRKPFPFKGRGERAPVTRKHVGQLVADQFLKSCRE